jgi:ubiquinone/menaquinone biosynthesis C-methylase UbiE
MTLDSVSFYEQEYLEMVAGTRRFFITPPDALVRAVCLEKAFPNKGAIALDFGCGEGRNAAFLLDMGYEVIGTDVSPGACAATKKRLGDKVDVREIAPGDKLPLADQSCDLVIAWEVLHWIGEKQPYLEVIADFQRLLKPGGRLIITMPTETHYLRYRAVETGESQYTIFAPSKKGCRFYAPLRETVKAQLQDKGFTVDRVTLYEYGDEKGENTLEYRFSMYAIIATRN